jgi:hypothetical protein
MDSVKERNELRIMPIREVPHLKASLLDRALAVWA